MITYYKIALVVLTSAFVYIAFFKPNIIAARQNLITIHQCKVIGVCCLLLAIAIGIFGPNRFLPESNIDEECLTGSWTSTVPGELWYRYDFIDGNKVTYYAAWPTDGKWGSPDGIGTWTVTRKRYSDTGNEYNHIEFSSHDVFLDVVDGSVYNCYSMTITHGNIGKTMGLEKNSGNPW
jgi:hypothetical protein